MTFIKLFWLQILLLTISTSVYGSNSGDIHGVAKQDTLVFITQERFALTGKNITITYTISNIKLHYDQLEAYDSTGWNPNWVDLNLRSRTKIVITGEEISQFVYIGRKSGLGDMDFTKCESLKYLQIKTHGALNLSKNVALEHFLSIFIWKSNIFNV